MLVAGSGLATYSPRPWPPAWPPNAPLGDAVDALDAVAHTSATMPRSSLPGDVILGQLRSTVVDLFQVAGLDIDESRTPDAAPTRAASAR